MRAVVAYVSKKQSLHAAALLDLDGESSLSVSTIAEQ
jgi:hypothetical protein